MDKSMPNHLILTLKSLATHTPRASFDGAEVPSIFGMYICMGAADEVSE